MDNNGITLEIFDQRSFFYQWDNDCKLRVTGLKSGDQVHFYRRGTTEDPLTVLVYALGDELVCDVPNQILVHGKTFIAYTYVIEDNGRKTLTSQTFVVKERPKPTDYVYTETEVQTWSKVSKRLDEEIKRAKEAEFRLNEKLSTPTEISYNDLKDKPFEVLGSEIIPAVDIPMKNNYVSDYNPDEQIYYVSEQTFTVAELRDASNPFYMEIYSSSEGSILGTFKMTQVDSILEYDGYIEILKKIGTGSGTFCARVFVMDSSTPVEVSYYGGILTKKGIYFTGSPWYYGAEVSRLYREEKEVLNVKKLDNQFLDLENHPVIKDILSRL